MNRGPSAYQPNALPLGQTGLTLNMVTIAHCVWLKSFGGNTLSCNTHEPIDAKKCADVSNSLKCNPELLSVQQHHNHCQRQCNNCLYRGNRVTDTVEPLESLSVQTHCNRCLFRGPPSTAGTRERKVSDSNPNRSGGRIFLSRVSFMC